MIGWTERHCCCYWDLSDCGLRCINADVIAEGLEISACEAAEVAAAIRSSLVSQGESFIFETDSHTQFAINRKTERVDESRELARYDKLVPEALIGDYLGLSRFAVPGHHLDAWPTRASSR